MEEVVEDRNVVKRRSPPKAVDAVDSSERDEGEVHIVVSKSTPAELEQITHFSWGVYLMDNPIPKINAVPVSAFGHAILTSIWDVTVQLGLFVEYEVGFVEGAVAFWIGRVEELQGYFVRVQPIGGSRYRRKSKLPCVWLNLLTDCARIGLNSNVGGAYLSPPMVDEEVDWKQLLMKEMSGGLSLSHRLAEVVRQETTSKIREGIEFEVVDTENISQFKVARVKKVVGNRLYFKYWDDAQPDEPTKGFWCHSVSGLFRPKGWCEAIGVKLSAPSNYNPKPIRADCLLDKAVPGLEAKVGMKLECLDPIQPFQLCTATVLQVLKDGFILIGFDHAEGEINLQEPNNDSMYVHVLSNAIFECGFADSWDIPLVPPKGYEEDFAWDDYFEETKTEQLQLSKLKKQNCPHEFEVGQRLEAVDLVESALVCAASVSDVKGRLLRIHFDGWPEEYDQWMDAKSVDIYPIGWCQSMGYPLTGPKGGLLQKVSGRASTFVAPRNRLVLDASRVPRASRMVPKRNRPTLAASASNRRTRHRASSEVLRESETPRRTNTQKRKSTMVDDYLPSEIDHKEVKAEAIRLGQNTSNAHNTNVKMTLEKLNMLPPASKKPNLHTA